MRGRVLWLWIGKNFIMESGIAGNEPMDCIVGEDEESYLLSKGYLGRYLLSDESGYLWSGRKIYGIGGEKLQEPKGKNILRSMERGNG